MNQVQELLALTDEGRVDEAVERLQGLFAIMAVQPGFIDATVGRGIDDPSKLIVLHTWETVADWLTFSKSPAKAAFNATRPEGLYTFEPIGMNWEVEASGGISEARAVRRTVCREGAGPSIGNAIASRLGSYVDDDVRFTGSTIQLAFYNSLETYRAARVPVGRRARAFISDDAFALLAARFAPRDVMTAGSASV